MTRAQLRAPFVALVSLHSLGVGLALVFATSWGLAFGGFTGEGPFFARQGGVFHLLVAAVYWMELRRHGGMDFMVLAKGSAVVFLLASLALGAPPLMVGLSAAGDGLMLVAALVLRGGPKG